jgi:hypothetical protein
VERTRFGEIRGRTAWLSRRDLVLVRLLHDAGQPLHIASLVREVNSLYTAVGRRPISHVTTGNYLSACDQIVPIGKSGYWALRSWRHVDTGTIVNMMAECLEDAGRPLTADEIFAHVSRRRPLRHASVASYLTSDPRFVKVDQTRYGLVGWPEAEAVRTWSKRGLATFVARLYGDLGTDVLPYRQVADAVVAASGLRPESVRGMLATNPVIATERPRGGPLMARFQSDYESALDGPRRVRRRPGTLVTAVTERIRGVLSEQPGQAMPVTVLRARVLADIATTKGTFYSYLGRMPDVEKVPDAGGKRLLVRLVRTQPAH